MKRIERLCNGCKKVFKYLPSTTKGHAPKTMCPKCDPTRNMNRKKAREVEPIPQSKEPFGCITIDETNARIQKRAEERRKIRSNSAAA